MNYHLPVIKLRKGRLASVLLLVALIVFSVSTGLFYNHQPKPVNADNYNAIVYSPQFSRNAEWDAQPGDIGYPDAFIQKIIQHNSYVVIPKFADRFNIVAHFADAKRINDAAIRNGQPVKVFDYFPASFWLNINLTAWSDYTKGPKGTFPLSDFPNNTKYPHITKLKDSPWFLHDKDGYPIPFFGTGTTVDDGQQPVGYMYDLSNTDMRRWAVNTVTDWMRQGPYKGMAFDLADALLGNVKRATTGDNNSTWNDLLCGAGAAVNGQGNCNRVASWNDGLAKLLSETKSSIGPMGGEVLYNGVGPATGRGATRNIELLDSADITMNESFCYASSAVNKTALTWRSVTDDITMMKQIASRGKKIFEITNFQSEERKPYGPYCFGAFMMGWQPGSSYWMFHSNYSDPLSGAYPYVPEQNLNLGEPVGSFSQAGNVLSRSFQNGFVVTNQGDAPANVTLPTAMTEFASGKNANTYAAGDKVVLGAKTSKFFLADAYLYPVKNKGGSAAKAKTSSSKVSGSGGGSSRSAGGGTVSGDDSTDSAAIANVKTSQPFDGVLSGIFKLYTTNDDGTLRKVEYYLDGTRLHTVVSFPDEFSLDTTKYSNGKHTLLVKYQRFDGTETTVSRTLTIANQITIGQQVSSVAKKALVPTIASLVVVGLLILVLRRVFQIAPRWLYHHHPVSGLIVGGNQAAIPSPTVHDAPGTVIRPDASDDREPPQIQRY